MKTFEVRDSYLYIYYDESGDVNSLIDLMKEISEICKKEKLKKILADLSKITGDLTILDRFRLGVAAVSIFRGLSKAAVIYKKVESNRFAETVAVNRGLPSLITHDIEKAKQWLQVE